MEATGSDLNLYATSTPEWQPSAGLATSFKVRNAAVGFRGLHL